ncbi:metal ABC transporter solute-binding protein, Zn/Mn family [Paenibacillus macerans]|uniref:metal ABC transporter solute-binding protein, Zn/Mn family n=1 Tax=Paenibacillus macerans TaxID=44252 RepID=UPI00203F588A|nr:zinc ABC transporter substrate-binding protein [Paenibacillus macerans]MCM3699641.1 zinc ABC transporter substrate-binding protein [Paenibacillus macerans]
MKFWNRSFIALSLTMMLVVAGCGSNANTPANSAVTNGSSTAPEASANTPATEKLEIKTSFYPMYEFTRHVAGDLANVENLVPAGMEPHDWEPTPQDMAAITEADVLVYNGAGMEGWVDQVLDSATGKGLKAIEASQGLEIVEGAEDEHEHGEAAHEDGEHAHEDGEHAHEEGEHVHEDGELAHEEGEHVHEDGEHAHEADEHGHDDSGHHHDHGGLDPHVWLSPALAIQEVRNIEKGLSEAAPQYADQFKANADAYVSELEALDKEFTETLKDSKRKDFITQHAAFGYLAKQYGLTQVPIAGLSPEQEPSASQMAEIVQFAKEHNVKTIFFETLVSSKVADTIASEIGAKSAVLNPIEGLTEEDLAKGLDYIGVMRQNLQALKAALNE